MTTLPFQSVAPKTTACKCCGAEARIFGVVDFNRNGESMRQEKLEPCGVPIYYHRCTRCGFLFTIALDQFSKDDFRKFIYNEQYALIDPEYEQKRPEGIAQWVSNLFATAKPLRVLDYGGGSGYLAERLKAGGFQNVSTYDPFVERFSARPEGKFDLVTCFEVVEHSPNPKSLFADLADLVADEGLIVISTLFQPKEIEQMRVNWWYIAPRNAHISLYTAAALSAVVQPLGIRYGSLNDQVHALCRKIPAFAQHLFRPSATGTGPDRTNPA